MMTNEEIIRALVRCTGIHTSTTCLECPYSCRESAFVHFGEDFCKDALLKKSLAIITNQADRLKQLTSQLEMARAERDANAKAYMNVAEELAALKLHQNT